MSQTNPIMGIWKLSQIKTKGECEVQLFPTKYIKNKNILQKAASRSISLLQAYVLSS